MTDVCSNIRKSKEIMWKYIIYLTVARKNVHVEYILRAVGERGKTRIKKRR